MYNECILQSLDLWGSYMVEFDRHKYKLSTIMPHDNNGTNLASQYLVE